MGQDAPFVPFELEEWQSRYETTVQFNLADSGCHPVQLSELVSDPASIDKLLALYLHYPPVGDHVVVMEPGYRQVRGCVANIGAKVSAFPLMSDHSWRPNLKTLAAAITPETRLIAVTNPNNPVGTILTEAEMDAIVAAAKSAGAWLLADEVYRGTERLTDTVTPSFWGSYDKVICVGSLSKAFGLPGLRLGWLVAPPSLVEQAWRRHEYATISASTVSMHLAEVALSEGTRQRLLARNRMLIRDGYKRLSQWIEGCEKGLLSVTPPEATALGFVRYHIDVPSVDVAHAIWEHGDVLVAAGSHFGVEHHLRITHGLEHQYLQTALECISRVLCDMKKEAAHGACKA